MSSSAAEATGRAAAVDRGRRDDIPSPREFGAQLSHGRATPVRSVRVVWQQEIKPESRPMARRDGALATKASWLSRQDRVAHGPARPDGGETILSTKLGIAVSRQRANFERPPH